MDRLFWVKGTINPKRKKGTKVLKSLLIGKSAHEDNHLGISAILPIDGIGTQLQ
jgi:hypothetical protein